jgi:hypothetical protein
MSEFEREDRYIVVKHSDIQGFWREDVREQFFAALERLNEHHVRIPQRKYLVIESDWPEYEPVWRMIEKRMSDDTMTPRIAAHEFLERGVKHMRDRAVQRDSDAGERSMARAVAAFNAQEGTNLTEAQGWRFMIQLKYARAVNGVFVADDYEDLCSYGGLAGEAASAEAK